MNPSDVRTLFDRVLENPTPDEIDVGAAVRQGTRLRRRRRAIAVGSAGAVITAASILAFGMTRNPGAETGVDPGDTRGVVPRELTVRCTPEGIEVSGDSFAATPEGAVYHVSSTMPDGTYLNIGTGSGGSGDALPATTATWIQSTPPGVVRLSCALHGDPDESHTARVTLTDPGNYWRDTTLVELGCSSRTEPFWAFGPGIGDSPQAAVDDLLAELPAPRRTYTARPAELAYVEATTQTWLVYTGDKPDLSVLVSRTRSGYTASPDYAC